MVHDQHLPAVLLRHDPAITDMDEHLLLALMESNDDRTLRILRSAAHKRNIFALNKTVFLKMSDVFDRKELSKRCQIVQVPRDFIINVNVVNNIHTIQSISLCGPLTSRPTGP